MFFVLAFSYTSMRKCIHYPRQSGPPGKTTTWQVLILWDVQILQQTSDEYSKPANDECQGKRSKQTSTAPSVDTPAVAQQELVQPVAQHHAGTSPQALQAGWVQRCCADLQDTEQSVLPCAPWRCSCNSLTDGGSETSGSCWWPVSRAAHETRQVTLSLFALNWADRKEPGRSDEQKRMSDLARDNQTLPWMPCSYLLSPKGCEAEFLTP